MAVYVLTLLIGVVAGLRALTAPAAISWAAHSGYLPLQGTPLAFLGFAYTPYIYQDIYQDDLSPALACTGAAVQVVADQHQHRPGQLYTWRK